jgi:FkbM family methyltransferase
MIINIFNLLYLINKVRRYVGLRNALSYFFAVIVRKDGIIKFNFLLHPLRIRVNENGDTATFNEVILRNDYEIRLKIDPKTILDCGANIGLTSIYFANKFQNAQIISIEPEKNNYSLLQENSSYYPKIKTIRSGIWSSSTFVKVIDGGKGSNAFSISETDIDDPEAIPSVSIKDIMDQNNWNYIDILKIDIEGSEKEIFTKNFEFWLPNVKVLIVETHDRYIQGCSSAVFKAIIKYPFNCKIQGSNFVFYKD